MHVAGKGCTGLAAAETERKPKLDELVTGLIQVKGLSPAQNSAMLNLTAKFTQLLGLLDEDTTVVKETEAALKALHRNTTLDEFSEKLQMLSVPHPGLSPSTLQRMTLPSATVTTAWGSPAYCIRRATRTHCLPWQLRHRLAPHLLAFAS